MSLNSITLGGNIGNDMEVRYTQNGKAIGSFPLAVTNGYGDNKRTMWVTCLVFGERAEKLAPHIRKGGKIVVSGRLDVRQYDRNDGTKGTAVEVAVAGRRLALRHSLRSCLWQHPSSVAGALMVVASLVATCTVSGKTTGRSYSRRLTGINI